MRWLLRSLAFWAISLPLFYLVGLPMLMEELSAKASRDAYAQCIDSMRTQGLMGTPNSPLTPELVDTYCHCVSTGLTFTKPDLLDAMHKRPPAALTALANAKSEQCNATLQQSMGMNGAAITAPTTPVKSNDTTVINF